MQDSRGTEEQSHHSTRRRLLAGLGIASIGGVAGCSSVLSDGSVSAGGGNESTAAVDTESTAATDTESTVGAGEVIAKEGFESGYTETFTAYPQQNADRPTVTSEVSQSGSRSLLLASRPGVESGSRVRMTETVTGPSEYSVFVRKLESGGGKNGTQLLLRDTDSLALVDIIASQYHGGIVARARNAEGTVDEAEITDSYPEAEWLKLSIRLQSDGKVVCAVDDESVTLDVERAWHDLEIKPRLQANAWDNGNVIEAAFDEYRVTRL